MSVRFLATCLIPSCAKTRPFLNRPSISSLEACAVSAGLCEFRERVVSENTNELTTSGLWEGANC